MDFFIFLTSLSNPEKKELLRLFQEDLAAPENETLKAFFQRAQEENRLPPRLRTIMAMPFSKKVTMGRCGPWKNQSKK